MQETDRNLDLAIACAKRPDDDPRGSQELLQALRSIPDQGKMLQMFDARAVAGPRHVASAFLHAKRALDEGRARLKDLGAAMALYLAGIDQLERALKRVGLSDDTRSFVIVATPARELDSVLESLHLTKAPEIFESGPTMDTMERLGVQKSLLSTVPQEKWELLAMEGVALVDLKG
jgi:tRNA threonylcarbamoyladenosine modification (KEOPS) complex Cgi121 subunit